MDSLSVFLYPFVVWLVRTTWQASILVCLVLLAQKVLGCRLGCRGRYWLWFLILLRIVMPWTPHSLVSIYNLLPSSPVRGYETPAALAKAVPISSLKNKSTVDPTPQPAGSDVFVPLVEANPARRGHWPQPRARATLLLSSVWLGGAVLLAGCVLVNDLRLRRMVRRGRRISDPWMLDLLEECKHLLGVRTGVRLIATDKIGPALFGFMRPCLLLPCEMPAGTDRAELRHIILHELAHLKRRDILTGYIASALHVLHWFNPLMAVGFRWMRADRELACDGLVLSVLPPEETAAYGRTIIHQIERLMVSQPRGMLARVSGDKARVMQRIEMISRFRRGSYRWSLPAMLLVAGLVGVGLTEGFATGATWDQYAQRDFPTTHQDKHANIIRCCIRHTQTDKFLVARDDGVFCDANEPGVAGLWEARFDEDFGNDRAQVVYFYSVATRKYLTWDKQGNVAVDGLEPNEAARWAGWNMGGAGARIVPYPFAHYYLRVLEGGHVKAPYGSDPGMFWDISQVWRVRTSSNPKSLPEWRRAHVPGRD